VIVSLPNTIGYNYWKMVQQLQPIQECGAACMDMGISWNINFPYAYTFYISTIKKTSITKSQFLPLKTGAVPSKICQATRRSTCWGDGSRVPIWLRDHSHGRATFIGKWGKPWVVPTGSSIELRFDETSSCYRFFGGNSSKKTNKLIQY